MENNQKRILLVEDHDDFATALVFGLQCQGYDVRATGSVREALAFLQDEPMDLLIVDWDLPDGNGGQVCQTARAFDATVPIVIISGVIDVRDKTLRACNADFYLDKPFHLVRFFENIRELLPQPERN